MIGLMIRAGAIQGVLPEGMSGFVQGSGESASAVTAEIWPLFFNSGSVETLQL
jgi:hypothetical protein